MSRFRSLNVTVMNNAPTQFPVGTNFVVWTATDAQGNSSSCTQAVVVIEHVAPIVSCPVDVTVQCDVPPHTRQHGAGHRDG